jgi:hypothetical protein
MSGLLNRNLARSCIETSNLLEFIFEPFIIALIKFGSWYRGGMEGGNSFRQFHNILEMCQALVYSVVTGESANDVTLS